MKEALSSFDVSCIVNDLQSLIGARIDKIYHPKLDHLVFALKTLSEGKEYMHFHVGKWLFTTKAPQEMPQQPSDFAMMLRKRISNSRIVGIKQQGFDRIVVLSLEKDEKYDLVFELFGDGNAILVKDGTIVQPLSSHTWKDRDVRAKRVFLFPPPVPDPSSLTPEEFRAILLSSDTDLVRTLATRLNIGGRYSEEICARAGIDKGTKANSIDLASAGRILETTKALKDEAVRSARGFVVLKDGQAEDVVPFGLVTQKDLAHEEFPSLSAAIESYVSREPKPMKAEAKVDTKEIDKIRRKIAQQESALKKLDQEAARAQETGDSIFANYGDIARTLSAAKERTVAGKELGDIEGYVAFDKKSSTLSVKLGGKEYRLNLNVSIETNARRYYEESKRSRKKLEGVKRALEEAKEALEKKTSPAEDSVAEPELDVRPTKRFWFERFRWFVSSEDTIVLGGKDARSNDILVKKHLEAGDRYAHADMHGAPSIVVKMRAGATEKTLHEACEFAVATSKAWNAKIGSAAGYWVLPEQVSKTPQSGEYLPKGAFVIRGRRNYSDKLDIKLGIGEIQFENERKVMCGPERAVKKHSKRYVIIRPGEKDKNEIAKKLAEAFQVPIEEIQSIMPPGDVDIVEQAGLKLPELTS